MPFSPATPMPFAHERYLGRPSCPRCGQTMIAAESTAVMGNRRVRHSWHCDGCDNVFETEVRLPSPRR